MEKPSNNCCECLPLPTTLVSTPQVTGAPSTPGTAVPTLPTSVPTTPATTAGTESLPVYANNQVNLLRYFLFYFILLLYHLFIFQAPTLQCTNVTCACVRTCEIPDNQCNPSGCQPGCQCPNGTLLDGKDCVAMEQCPCFHGGKIYKVEYT